jgi:ligand-binding sensor domain-containing protein
MKLNFYDWTDFKTRLRMIVSLKQFLLLLVLVISIEFSLATRSLYARYMKFEHISVNEGLSQSSARVLLQDSKGFIWCGTQDGFNKYDGIRFKTYRYNPHNKNSLSDNFILSAIEDRKGIIWIGTNGGGLNRFDPKTEKFTRFFHEDSIPGSLSNDFVNSVYEDTRGQIWVGTVYGLNLWNEETQSFKTFLFDTSNTFLNGVGCIYEDQFNNFWIGSTGMGLFLFDRESGNYASYQYDPNNSESICGNSVVSILEDNNDQLWIATTAGLNLFDRQTKRFKRYQYDSSNPYSISNNGLNTIFQDRDDNLWIGSLGGGLNRYDRKNDRFIRYQNDPMDPNSLNNNFIFSILEDHSGSLWIGTGGGGINKFDPQKVKFRHYKIEQAKINNSLDNFVWSILEDEKRIIWIGTQGGGLYRFDRRSGEFKNYRNDPSNTASLSQDVVLAIAEDHGNLWIGTQGGGLNYFDRKTEKFKRYLYNPNDSLSLGSNLIRSLLIGRNGTLWIGTQGGGLNYKLPGSDHFHRFTYNPDDITSISNNLVMSLYEDRNGNIWVGTSGGGLCMFDRRSQKFERYMHAPDEENSISHNRIRVINSDHSGNLWIGTDFGLNEFSAEDGKFKKYTSADGLPNDVIYGILPDEQGNLWISTNYGISKFNPETDIFKNYDIDDGLQSNEFNTGASYQNDRGEMFFGGINGFNIFHPADIKDNPHIPPVVLTDFTIFGKPAILNQSITYIDKIILNYKENSFSFEFAALDYTNPAKNKYAYKLEGLNDYWIYPGSGHTATYTKLDPGKYTFRVNGSNNDLIWNLDGARVDIVITPPFWATTWFRLIIFILAAFLLYLIYRLRVNTIHYKSKLHAAHEAQMSIMPANDPKTDRLDISGICIPANEVGGDFYDYQWIEPDKEELLVVIGDVSGKAMKSAMTAVMSSGLIYAKSNDTNSLEQIMSSVNETLYVKTDRNMFTALILAGFDLNARKARFINAGLCEPVLKSKGTVELLQGRGQKFPLGANRDTKYKEQGVILHEDDLVVFITDGIPEAQNKSHQMYGYDTLKNLLDSLNTHILSAVEIRDKIIDDVKKFTGNAPQHDDMTIVVVKMK